MKYGLKESAIEHIQSVLARHPEVKSAILYGSRSIGSFKTGSDIDLTLLGGEDLTMKTLYRIMDEIDDLLLPYTFDLSIHRDITDPDVLDHIQRVGVIFYQKTAESNHGGGLSF